MGQELTPNGVQFGGTPVSDILRGTKRRGVPITSRPTTKSATFQDGTNTTILSAEVVRGQGTDPRGFDLVGRSRGLPDVVPPRGVCKSATVDV